MVTEEDLEALHFVWKHPKVWPGMVDDFMPPPEEINFREYVNDERAQPFIIRDRDIPVGAIVFWKRGSVWWEMHGGVLPGWRGGFAVHVARLSIDHMFTERGALKITAELPSDHRAGLVFVEKIGFKREGVNRLSIMRGGQLRDQIYLGVTKDEFSRWLPLRDEPEGRTGTGASSCLRS